MWFTGTLARMVYGTMRYFMHVGNQKSIRIQIGVDRDMRGAVRQYPKIAKAGSPGFYNTESERKLLLKLLAVGYCHRRYVLV